MPTILVVDDSATDRLLAGGLLAEDGDFDTVSGWLGDIFGKIPDVGEQKEANGYNITVLKKSDQNIESVKLELLLNAEDTVDLH